MEPIVVGHAEGQLARRAYYQVHAEPAWDALPDRHCLAARVVFGNVHDHEQIRVGILGRRAVSVGAEQDDLVGLKALRNLPGGIH